MGILSHNNRLDYGKSLMPDDGWETSWAIGTTYSLDLEVLLSVPLALFHAKYLTENTTEEYLRTDMLDALEKVKEQMFVFVHENNIRSTCGYSILMGFLDQNIWNIPLDSPTMNFHPKVWLVRYERKTINGHETKNGEYKYRLVVMSRNITASTDFDIAVAMDSYHTEKEQSENESLITMMTDLMKLTNKRNIVKQLSRELKHIRFVPPPPFDQKGKTAIFWPHRFRRSISPLLTQLKEVDELMVISPFIDDYALNALEAKCVGKRPILVSREYEMNKCKPETLRKWDCYMWNTMLEEAGDYEEYETNTDFTTSHSISLHTKIFIAKAVYGRDFHKYNNWFVGSTNCTRAGFTSNYEAQVQLRSIEPGTSVKDVLESLKNPDAPLIMPYKVKELTSQDKEEDKKQRFQRELLYNLSHLQIKGKVEECSDGRYVTRISADYNSWSDFWHDFPNDDITLRLFAFSDNSSDVWHLRDEAEHSFASLPCSRLSPFLYVTVSFATGENKQFLIHVPMPMPERRHGIIMSEILDCEEKLMRYLIFCLDNQADEKLLRIGKNTSTQTNNDNKRLSWEKYSLPIYERLLLAASRDKLALKQMRDNIEKLKNVNGKDGKPLLSNEFLKMWNLFAVYSK